MFIVSPQDVEIANVVHPKGSLIALMHCQGRIFSLDQSFGDNRDRAITFSRHLTENMGKLCVLLEESQNFSVWSEDEIERYPSLIDEFYRSRTNLDATDIKSEQPFSIANSSHETLNQPIGNTKHIDNNEDASHIPVSHSNSDHPDPPQLPVEPNIQSPSPQLVAWDLAAQKRKRAIATLGVILLAGLGVAGLASWLQGINRNSTSVITPQITSSETVPNSIAGVTIDPSLPNPKVLTMDGSTSMVEIIHRLRTAYAERHPNIPTTYGQPNNHPGGSNQGLDALINRTVVLAASSRPLNPKEAEAGIQVVAIAKDTVAVVVGIDNPFKGGLTMEQLRQIYQGKITNWSELGGTKMPIRAINRAKTSGTRDIFQSMVLIGQEFAADSSQIITWPRDETTAVLRALGKDGIYYTTLSQLKEQELVRIVSIDGIEPNDMAAVQSGKYGISRNVYLAFPKRTSPAVKEFIDLARSPQGQEIMHKSGFTPIMPMQP